MSIFNLKTLRVSNHTPVVSREKRGFSAQFWLDDAAPPCHKDRNSPAAGLFLLFAQPGDARQMKRA